jgi:CrcB protein
MLYSALIVSLGGALGTFLRFIISKLFVSTSAVFTYVALVNIIGCLVAGLIAGYMDRHIHTETQRLFLITGIMGGFTTFSAFSLDAINLMHKGRTPEAIIYVAISVIGAILAAITGYYLSSKM